MTRFSISNLSVFERHGATVEQRAQRAGCRITLPNGWGLSVQWGPCMYGSNYDSMHLDADESHLTATTAEVAVIKPGGGLVDWKDGTVQGWCSMERVQHILDLLAEDKLLVGMTERVAGRPVVKGRCMTDHLTLVVELIVNGKPMFLNFMDVDLDKAREAGGAWVDAPGMSGYTAQASIWFGKPDVLRARADLSEDSS